MTLPTQMLKFRGYSKCELATPRYIPENSKFLIKILQTEHHYRFTLPLTVAKKIKKCNSKQINFADVRIIYSLI